MKKSYIQPNMWLRKISLHHQLLVVSKEVTRTAGNANIDYGGGGSGPARAPQQKGVWDDYGWDE